ncbi:LysR family transcriptional regulator [Denitrobaculum tricleocarpae]|uniref:LysR family transcriptional regulator n=1 Tax=Denitrobaculum tricleocarpae TaxID=2591009 RepID=A0A545TY94_9PROT|nr:LysR family transcriptional regulator [Denitrobaculum tricleocarpae]TQV82195.1 LysR family transcriptional regulator [Denitrobaculum tricleocarpae]
MTYRLPSLNTLRAFEAAARHLSFKTAAGELGVTPGAVSQQVKKLEGSLGVALFRRLPHGLLLTGAGETYLPRITRVFEDLTDATEEIAPDINGRKFTLGLCPKAAAVLPEAWPVRREALQPHIRQVIETSDIECIRRDEIDCLIRIGGGPYGDLTLVELPHPTDRNGASKLHFICKNGLADCRQSKAILADLDAVILSAGHSPP